MTCEEETNVACLIEDYNDKDVMAEHPTIDSNSLMITEVKLLSYYYYYYYYY